MSSTEAKPPIRWVALLVLGIPPILALTVVPWYGLTHGYEAWGWIWFMVLITFCEMSITAGYHRLWSHKAYQAHPLLRISYAIGGACALQSDCLAWASDHRRHHLYADNNDKDPYSAGRGFWYSHFGWMLREYEATRADYSNIKDLYKDPILVWQKKYYVPLVLLMNIGVPVAIGWFHGDVVGAFLLLGVLRLVLSQHFTYLINSAAHMWGKRQYSPEQSARDNWLISLLTFGEGFHNYHHTFAWDYRNGIKWYHWDPTKWWIKGCHWLGLAENLRASSRYRQELTRLKVQFQHALAQCEQFDNAGKWKQWLENEYQAFINTLNNWYALKQQWYQVKSRQLSRDLHDALHELDPAHIRARYRDLKKQLREQRRRWKALQARFAFHYACAA